MAQAINPIRGTKDYIDDDALLLRHVMDTAWRVAQYYGFNEIVTPIMESLSVFNRSLGETSDVVSKEMYVFKDRSEADICLRPENTASVVRAFISNGLTQKLPQKFFYRGPMFRYERPQKGRLRQFHQIGVELLGANTPKADADIIMLGHHILQELDIASSITLELNSLGDTLSRQHYREALIAYFTQYKHDLSAESQLRLHQNPLRILDSKDDHDRKIIANCPTFDTYLNDESKRFFDELQAILTLCNVNYTYNQTLVRGLDYYCHTAFEFTTTALGAQGTVLGGGRYDGLVLNLGGPDIAGVGFAAGVERLMMLCSLPSAQNNVISLVPIGDHCVAYATMLEHTLRSHGFTVNSAYEGAVKKRMKYADSINANFVIIIGDDELQQQKVTIKNMQQGIQDSVPHDNIVSYLRS